MSEPKRNQGIANPRAATSGLLRQYPDTPETWPDYFFARDRRLPATVLRAPRF
jgi:hypothetical protein